MMDGYFVIGVIVTVIAIFVFARHRCKWSKWTDYAPGQTLVVQIRRCEKCGKAETRSS